MTKFAVNLLIFFLLSSLTFNLYGCSAIRYKQQIETWHELRAKGDAAMGKRDFATAEKSFLEALKIAEPIHSQPIREAVSLHDLSKVCLATSDVDQAVSISAQALALANQRTKAPAKQVDAIESSLAQCLSNVGQVLAQAKKYDQAAISYREARAMFVDLYQRSKMMISSNYIIGSHLAQVVDGLGTSYRELGQLKEARQAYLSITENGIARGLPSMLRDKLADHFCQIPDTSTSEMKNYAAKLGCIVPPAAAYKTNQQKP